MVYMMILFIVLIVAVPIIIEYIAYAPTAYRAVTHRDYLSLRFDKGSYGEYQTYMRLREFEKDGAKFLFNCYLPKKNSETTEIDVLMIDKTGIYVFESKNYGGWIFGSSYQKMWTQTLPNGRRGVRKERFFNPVMQNKSHIRWLQNQVGASVPMYSLIVFSERCTLKKIDVDPKEARVIKRYNVKSAVNSIRNEQAEELTQERIQSIYTKLYQYTQVDNDVKIAHIKQIRDKED